MATGDIKVDIYLKKFLPQQQITENFFDYLEKKIKDNLRRVYADDGVFVPDILVTNLLSASAPDTFTLITPLEGTDGPQGNQLILDPSDANLIPFENELGIDYYVGLRANQIPRETEVNVRTGEIKYTFLEESIGELGEPDVIVDDGDETLTITVDSVCEPGVSHAGRTVVVWLKQAVSQVQAFEELPVIWDGVNNKIETVTALGQTLGNISTDPSDYQIFLRGPTIRKNTDLRLDNNLLFVGIVTGAGPGNTPNTFDESDVNNLFVSVPTLITLFDAEHELVGGTHTVITPEQIFTKQTTPGLQLDTQVNATDEDSPDAPVSHTLFPSSGGSGLQSVKWQMRDSSGNVILFFDAHGNAYFQRIAAVESVFQSQVVVEGDSIFGDDINSDKSIFNSSLQSFTDFIFLIDSDDNGTGHSYQFYNNAILPANEIFRILESGDLLLYGNLLKNGPSIGIDLDNDNDETGESFTITKDNFATQLFLINEFGDAFVSRDLSTIQDVLSGRDVSATRDVVASRDSLTGTQTVYSDAEANPIIVNASLNQVHDETLARKLLRVFPNGPNDTLLNVSPSKVIAADGSEYALSKQGNLVQYPGGTVDFSNGVVTGGGTNFTPYTPSAPGRYFKYGLVINNNSELVVILPTDDAATPAAASDPLLGNDLPVGIVVVQDNGSGGVGTINPLSESSLVRFGATGSGSSSQSSGGRGAPIEPEPGFEAALSDDLTTVPGTPESNVEATITNAQHNPDGSFRMLCDRTLVGNTGIVGDQNEIQRLDFSQVPDGGVYRLSHDGNETVDIPAGTNAAGLEGFLESLPSIDDVSVTGDETTGFQITYVNTEGGINQPEIIVSQNSLFVTLPILFTIEEILRTDFVGVGVLLNGLIANGDKRFFFQGGANITATPGKLTVTSASPGAARVQAFSGTGRVNLDSFIGTIRFKWTPDAAGSFKVLFTAVEFGGGTNAIILQRQPSGDITYQAFDNIGFTNISFNFGNPGVSAGVEVEVEFSYDFNSGAQRLFVDGVQIGGTDTQTITRTQYTANANFHLGGDNNGNFSGNWLFDDLQIFSNIQHTANFASEIPRVLAPIDEVFRAKFDTVADADFSASLDAATLSAPASIIGGKLNIGSSGFARWLHAGSAVSSPQGTIRFKWTPDFSGPPVGLATLFVVRDDSNNSEITIKVDSSGNIHAVTTTSGSVTTDTNFGLIPISNSQEIEIEYDYDFQGGTQRMFVNGVQIGAPSSVTGTLIFLNSNGTRIVVGSDEGSEPITGDFDDLQIFANVQHTSDFSGEVPRNVGTDPVPLTPSTTVEGDPGDQTIGLTGLPNFTVAPGDIVYSFDLKEFRRITIVSDQQNYTLDGHFSQDIVAGSIMVSQAVWTKNLLTIGDVVEETRFLDVFGIREIDQIHISYRDSLLAGDLTADLQKEARSVASASNSGLSTDVPIPLSDTFGSLFVRPNFPDQIDNYGLLDNTNKERLFLVFFCNPDNSLITNGANLLEHKTSFYRFSEAKLGGFEDSGFIISDGTGGNGIASVATVFDIDLAINVTEVTLDFNYVPGVNSGKPDGELDVIAEGLIIPRFFTGIDPAKTIFYKEIANNKVRFSVDLTLSINSIHVRRSVPGQGGASTGTKVTGVIEVASESELNAALAAMPPALEVRIGAPFSIDSPIVIDKSNVTIRSLHSENVISTSGSFVGSEMFRIDPTVSKVNIENLVLETDMDTVDGIRVQNNSFDNKITGNNFKLPPTTTSSAISLDGQRSFYTNNRVDIQGAGGSPGAILIDINALDNIVAHNIGS